MGVPGWDSTEDQHDKIRWIDTSTMICDPLTKAGPAGFADRMVSCMTTGILDLEPTVESQMKKLQQQKRRRVKAEENERKRASLDGVGDERVDDVEPELVDLFDD